MRKTLYLLALAGQISDRLFLFYACNTAEAEARATDLEKDNNATRRDLRQFEHGFRVIEIELPGTIEADD